jgi:glyoxylase-like metal-dependent hydrolase (beta-lactamase superfamily II)
VDGGIAHPFEAPPAPGEAARVAPGVLWLRLPLPMALNHVNAYALEGDDGWTLVDTGFASAETQGLWQGLLDGPLAGRPVARVLVTHHHPDHVGLAGWFQSRGAELLMPRTGWLYARMLTLDTQDHPSLQAMDFLRRAGMPAEMLARRETERPFNFSDVVAPMPTGFTRIAEGDVLTLGTRRWLVRMGNGHAPEHATLWSLDDSLILAGDQLLPGISANIGVYATEPGADPLREWLASCRAFQPLAKADHLVLPGHKTPYTGLPARLSTMIAEHEGALDRLLTRLAQGPATACDLFPTLYRREIRPGEYGLALAEAVAHVNHLAAQGLIRAEMRGDGAALWCRT